MTTRTDKGWTTIALDSHPAGAACRVALDCGWYPLDDGGSHFVKSSRKVSGRILYARRSNYNGHIAIVATANVARGKVATFKNCHPACVTAA